MFTLFGINDLWKFFLSFFLVLPIVTIIHELGHYFFAKLFGGKVIVHIGTGNVLFKFGSIRIRKLYFYDGWCEYISISKKASKLDKILVYLGGSIFNILSIFLLNTLILNEVLEPSIFFYQFTYFSFYFLFFSLFPINHLNGCPSDGMAALNILTNKKFSKNPSN
ncbi:MULTISPECIES: site-2 protease family protein [Bacillaceae]|uniref:site-2 protease family protein n=1 Tax=Bacillaceae TaxID=186817 RepID=UPI00031B1452